MPGYDRTGPLGMGQMTGRGFGPCGRGLGMRRGFGRGYGFRARPLTKTEEKQLLQEELELAKEEQKEIEDRLKELK